MIMLRSDIKNAISDLENNINLQPRFICIEDDKDTEETPENDVISKIQQAYYETLFPEQSVFELPDPEPR